MDTVDTSPAAPPPPEHKRRNVWIWVSALLAIAVAGLLVWGLSTQSDLDDTNAELDQVQAQVAQNEEAGSDFAAAARTAYDDLAERVGAAGEDAQAQIDAARAQIEQAAEERGNQADDATAKASIAAECAKAYVSAFGALFEGGDPAANVDAVREQIAGITDECRAALNGS
jgi:hypothetical protein